MINVLCILIKIEIDYFIFDIIKILERSIKCYGKCTFFKNSKTIHVIKYRKITKLSKELWLIFERRLMLELNPVIKNSLYHNNNWSKKTEECFF